jgi:acetoin utilization deacetylase AcuC-like enzyme
VEAGATRVLLLDCDYHFGNGTDDILARLGEQTHGRIDHVSLGRRFKRRSQANEYMDAVGEVCRRIQAGTYALVLYQAGMDVLVGDPMGGILTYEQTYRRDLQVFEACHASGAGIAWNLAGGYSTDENGEITPVLRGHRNTFIACARVFDGVMELQPETERRPSRVEADR